MRPRPPRGSRLQSARDGERSRRDGPDAVHRLDVARRDSSDDRSERSGRRRRTSVQGYATDGDGDGFANVWDPADAIAGAARLLRANGAPADYRRAVFAYNPADAYVAAVLAKANEYRGAFAPGASGGARTVLAWAVAHVGRFTYNLGPPTDRGGSVQDMQSREPAGSTCDCSMFARWAFAQAGVDIGTTTSVQWTANGLLPSGASSQQTSVSSRAASGPIRRPADTSPPT